MELIQHIIPFLQSLMVRNMVYHGKNLEKDILDLVGMEFMAHPNYFIRNLHLEKTP